jgi:ParB family chromosome partitioning protein
MYDTFPIDRIVVSPSRHRRDMGDINSLAASIADLGLLHPIVIHPDGTLIAGERRLRAAQQLGWREIPVHVVDLDAMVKGEFAENAVRKDFTISEAVAIKRALGPIEQTAARERQGTRTDLSLPGNLPTSSNGRAADKAATGTGFGRRTLEKAEAVVDAAEANPERYGKFLDAMDRTGRVNGVFQRLKIFQQAERIRNAPPPLPGRGPYYCATLDFPWGDDTGRYDDPSHRFIAPHPPMTLEQICAFPLASILAPDAVVWVWFTNYHIHRSIHRTVLDALGLQSKQMLTWGKPHFGGGMWLHGQTEQCILAVRGRAVVELTNQSTLLLAPPREQDGHSLKPREFYDLVESLCPAPRYVDIFSRYRNNERWDCYGDEAPAPESVPELLPNDAEV